MELYYLDMIIFFINDHKHRIHVFKKPHIIYSIITEEQSNNIEVVLGPNSNSAAENYSN